MGAALVASTLFLTVAPTGLALAQEASATAAEAVVASEAASDAAVEAAPVAAEAEAPAPALLASQVPLELDSANTTFLIFSTAMVLMMTLPGLALFYGGMVRKKNLIATVTQSVAVTCLVAVIWFAVGYSLAFGVASDPVFGVPGELANLYIGGFDTVFLKNVTSSTAYKVAPGVPEMTWIAYQMTFAIITPALITGAFAERVKLSGLMLFMALWSVLVYAPICHMVWGGGIMGGMGVLDFAGGAVVHVNAGVAGLVAAIFLGKRKDLGKVDMNPNNVVLVMIGASLLFVGWIGFNAGSEWSGDGVASAALLNTLLATCVAGLTWKIVEWTFRSKPSLLGILSGMVAGLVAITPACGFVTPASAMIIGALAGPVCYVSSVWVKKLLGYDDSLDAFGIHGVGGALGAILTGAFADPAINSLGKSGIGQMFVQAQGLGITILWSAVGTLLILIICKFTTGLRVSASDEETGLDKALHDEALEH